MAQENISEEEKLPFRLRPVAELRNYTFYVNSYQRGYKWTSQEVSDLLNDINDFTPDQGIYCLQPLVVKKPDQDNVNVDILKSKNGNVYELIDGQQRVTTIYMILSFLHGAPDFCSIVYKTRPESETFLNDINKLPIASMEKELLNDILKLTSKINEEWQKYISSDIGADFNNVDNYHFFQVYQTISLWFAGKNSTDIGRLKENLLVYTNVIWYKIESIESAEKVFLKINRGKISLTNAELIKALFLISNRDNINKELSEFKQNAIAHEWDIIETTLHNPEFWYFINEDPKKYSPPTRIDFLFDILKDKDVKKKHKWDNFYTYRQYDKEFKTGNPLDWSKVKVLFDQLQEWFEDRDIYHRMGFIISQNFKTIKELVKLQQGHGKKYFKQVLRDIIKEKFTQKDDKPSYYDFNALHYENSYNAARAVLELFNIETYQKSDASFRFPFHRFKMEDWSIEHIHAQEAKELTNGTQVSLWVSDMIKRLKDESETQKNLSESNMMLQQRLLSLADEVGSGNINSFNRLLLNNLSGELSEYLETHKISNLALLDKQTNSAIGNKRFLYKRNEILDIDKKGGIMINNKFVSAFIPVCTKNAFLKYYTKGADNIQMDFWGTNDRDDYESAIAKLLNYYYTA